MEPRTLEALKASIAKWERNAEANDPYEMRTGADDCPLCDLFYDDNCAGCPVMAKTSAIACSRTPYMAAHSARYRWLNERHSRDSSKFRDVAHEAARAEVAFLKSLLPTEEAP